jgi:signal transduction histidine kinase
MDATAHEQRYATARDALLKEFGSRWTRRKPWLFSIHRAMTIALMVAAGATGRRFFSLLALYAVMMVLEVRAALRIRNSGCSEHDIAIDTAIGMMLCGFGCSFTGGFASPLVPTLLAAVVIPAAAFGRRPPTWALFGQLVGILGALLVLPRSVLGCVLPEPWIHVGIAMSIAFAVWVSVVNIVTITEIYTRAAVDAARMREQVLDQHDTRARDLETIGAKVAHELKNPLAAIAGLVQLLRQGDHEPKTKERLAVISSEVGRVEAILRDYLAFTRPLDSMSLVAAPLAPVVDDVLTLLGARASAAGVSLERVGEPLDALIDAVRLREALINLVDNAIEASPRGKRVQVELSRARDGVVVRVRDHGEGIAPDVLARVGTPYFTTRPTGTGLGVVLARSVVEAHGGTLEITSEAGEGTTAEISLRDATDGSSARAA